MEGTVFNFERESREEPSVMPFGSPQPLRLIGRPAFGSIGWVDARGGLSAQGRVAGQE